MSIRNFVTATVFTGLLAAIAASPVSAQQVQSSSNIVSDALVAASQAQPAVAAQQSTVPSPAFSRKYRSADRGRMLLIPMHVLTATMQGLDAHSSFKAFDNGAVEVNPMLAPFKENRGAFTAIKVGAAAGLIYATDRIAKHHPIRAMVVAAAVNSAYAMIAMNNYRVANQMR